ncbi:hypothetical protein BH23PLA1_BH23PLA1_09130 [soil metagenome]
MRIPRPVATMLVFAAGFGLALSPATARLDDLRASETPESGEDRVQTVIEELDQACRERTIYMIGPEKAQRLAELVREHRPKLVVECGTAIGYSGLWIARELQANGEGGRLITIEIDPDRAREATENFERAGLSEHVEVRVGDARELVKEVEGPIDFAFIDCNYGNYVPCLLGIEPNLAGGGVIVADNVGMGASALADYLKRVRQKYDSRIEWFDMDLPWGKRDAFEISIDRRNGEKPSSSPQ